MKLAQVAGGRPERVREAPGFRPPAPRLPGSGLRDSHADDPLIAATGIVAGSGLASESSEQGQGSVGDTGLKATASDRDPIPSSTGGEAYGGGVVSKRKGSRMIEKLPALNTGRHETPSETGLWDRLRADLNNLGAAYGPITEGVGDWEVCAYCGHGKRSHLCVVSGCVYPPITDGVGESVATPEPVEIYERAAWDLPITFTARLGGRTP